MNRIFTLNVLCASSDESRLTAVFLFFSFMYAICCVSKLLFITELNANYNRKMYLYSSITMIQSYANSLFLLWVHS